MKSIGAPGNHAEAFRQHPRRKRFSVGDDLLLIRDKFGLHSLEEADSFSRDHMHERTALRAGEHGLVNGGAMFSLARMRPARGPRRVLWVVEVTMSAIRTELGCRPAATKAGEMRHVDQRAARPPNRRSDGNV